MRGAWARGTAGCAQVAAGWHEVQLQGAEEGRRAYAYLAAG